MQYLVVVPGLLLSRSASPRSWGEGGRSGEALSSSRAATRRRSARAASSTRPKASFKKGRNLIFLCLESSRRRSFALHEGGPLLRRASRSLRMSIMKHLHVGNPREQQSPVVARNVGLALAPSRPSSSSTNTTAFPTMSSRNALRRRRPQSAGPRPASSSL